MIDFLLEIPLKGTVTDLSGLFKKKPHFGYSYSNENLDLLAWGDPILDENGMNTISDKNLIDTVLNNIKGHFYYLILTRKNKEIYFGNSFFSILPVYYTEDNNSLYLSNNAINLGNALKIIQTSNRFLLETLLFNYPLFNNSIIEDINLLPCNSFIHLSDSSWHINKHTRIEELFTEDPLPWRKSLDRMSDIFLNSVEKYLPDSHYFNALTGGFDGRTLVSSGMFYKKNFSTYSFGTSSSADVEIASSLAGKAKIPYFKIALEKEYVQKESLQNGLEFIYNSSGIASFSRAHYLYAAKLLSSKTDVLVTGNFGSEVFRAVHNPGVVFSQNLISLFDSDSIEEALEKVENSVEFSFIQKEVFLLDWEQCKNDIYTLPCSNPDYKHLSKNQRFYVFVFEEVFRKYFGAEMINQFKYLKNRTPFLDQEFFKAILQTGLAGIHSEFFESNPLKRFKGQVLYAHIIRKAYPQFGKMMTDKGYKPDDLLNFFGKFNIAKGYLKKITRKSIPDFDPYAVNKAWETNRDHWLGIPASEEFFDLKKVNDGINKEILFKIISLSYCVKSIQ